MDLESKFWIYLRAYGRHFLRTTPWVTLICVLLFVLFVAVPQAGELILSQATRPAADESSGGFYWRMALLTAASLVLALSVWLSARLLVHTEAHAARQVAALTGARQSPARSAAEEQVIRRADEQASLFVPRQLGLSVFITLQIAAAGSMSEQGYWLPIALVAVWLVLLVTGLLRMTSVEPASMRAWWFSLLLLVLVYAAGAVLADLQWLGDRVDSKWKTEQQGSVGTMGWAAVATCALLLAATRWIAGPHGPWVQGVASVLALGIILYSLYDAGLLSSDDMYWLFFLLQSLAAGLYWAIVLSRRRIAAWSRHLAWARMLTANGGRNVWLTVTAFIIGCSVVLAVWAEFEPVGMGGYVGAAGIVLMFLAFLVLAVSLIQAWLGRSTWGRTIPGGAVGVILLAFFFAYPTAPEAPRKARESPGVILPVGIDVRGHTELPADGPLFAVAAHGGGIRAAQYTAAFMAWLDHETGYQLSDRLVAASGASGGSVGLAVWSAALAAGCRDRDAIVAVDGQHVPPCVVAINQTLAQDHLGPLMAAGLFRDYLQFLRNPARGYVLEESILHAASRVSREVLAGRMEDELLAALPRARHALLLNSAKVGTAQPYAMGTREDMLHRVPLRDLRFTTSIDSYRSGDLSLLRAAMHSARFPLISPKGLVQDSGPTVVDGGYFDNSGAAVLRQHMLAWVNRVGADPLATSRRLVVISLDSEPVDSLKPPTAGDGRNSFGEIVATVLAARGAHGHAAWHQMCRELPEARFVSARPGAPLWPGCEWPSENSTAGIGGGELWQQQQEARAPALGWHLSRRSALRVSNDARGKAEALARALGPSRARAKNALRESMKPNSRDASAQKSEPAIQRVRK